MWSPQLSFVYRTYTHVYTIYIRYQLDEALNTCTDMSFTFSGSGSFTDHIEQYVHIHVYIIYVCGCACSSCECITSLPMEDFLFFLTNHPARVCELRIWWTEDINSWSLKRCFMLLIRFLKMIFKITCTT